MKHTMQYDFPPVIWWMLTATGVTRITQFMTMPFMALFMSTHTHASPSVIGLAIGMSPLCATLFSFVGGTLSDRFGRRGLMVAAMIINAIAMCAFATARTIAVFFLISVLTGMSRALFEPASQAMMTDVIEKDKRASVFAMDYWIVNIGASVGPVLGGYFGTVATGVTFYIAAAVSALYAIVIIIRFPESKPQKDQRDHAGFTTSLRVIGMDKALLYFIVASTITSLDYSQFDTTLPQFMQSLFGATGAAKNFSIVFATTGFEVVVLQFIVNRFSSRWSIARTFTISQTLYCISFICLGLSRSLTALLLTTVVLIVGEVMGAPRIGEYVSSLSKNQMRGAYFGANSLANLGLFLGPWLGGILLHRFGGTILFLIVGLTVLASIPFYRLSYRHNAETNSRRWNPDA
ncbi:MDR family MFS transporter [Alicyclobacillus dauci]|uniref:MFS transporter n=1 Tax=Alicyclobacillus dauci TaxID=1475485 RepID=A0ABY6Z721_9BACL|nr:MFS transporter [Alicyclobacillus dauci]WAH38689.1 MFS transporter [Alicyclobacillus dauci]